MRSSRLLRCLFERACGQGQQSAKACNNLGELYWKGYGVPQDLDLAQEYFHQACFLGKYKDVGYDTGCKNERRLKCERNKAPDSPFNYE